MAIHLTEQARQDVTIGKGTIYLDSDTGELNVAGRTTPHIIPGVLYPAVSGNDINGNALGGSYVYGTAHTDGRKYYYTDIKGSKPIKDPRIGGHFGSQRYRISSLQLLEQETATHGKNVYSVDGREYMRASAGTQDWKIDNASSGTYLTLTAASSGAGEFIEIVAYANMCNFQTIGNYSGSNSFERLDVYVDGTLTFDDPASSPISASSPLLSRYLVGGSTRSAISSGVALGIHTFKFQVAPPHTGSAYMYLSAIELIAQDTSNRNNIQIPSQNVVSYGKKFTVSGTPHYDPFNGFVNGTSLHSDFVDTATSLGLDTAPGISAKWAINSTNHIRPYQGGRVVKWVDSDGTIKTSVNMMPPNAQNISTTADSETTTPSATNTNYKPAFSDDAIDHSQAEVAKTFHFREFGNGSANGNASYPDASTLSGTADIAYVMDDGLTSFSGDDANSTGAGNSGFYHNTSGAKGYITFIGTGFRLNNNNSNVTDTAQCSVDGVQIQNAVSNASPEAQNLPFGTHVVSENWVSSGGSTPTFDEFTFFQPKRPPIPEDACVIADYMLMADYVKSTNTTPKPDDLSKGIRLQTASRDIFYDRTGGSWDTLGHVSYHGSGFISIPVVAGGNATSLTAKLPYFGFTKGALSVRRATDATDIAVTATNTSGSLESTNVTVSTRVVPALSGNVADASHSSSNVYGFFNWEKSDGALGNNTVSFDDANLTSTYDWMYISAMEIVSPIHTSHHYQSFETPYLHELVGGDRNMEQTNLVCSPDGKTWDEVTRDVSYLASDIVLSATAETAYSWSDTIVLDEWRGFDTNKDRFNKDSWAIAYDRLICLKDGTYEMFTSGSFDTHQDIYVNGNVSLLGANGTHSGITLIRHMKRGDYIQVLGDFGPNTVYRYKHFYIKRVG